MAESYPNRAALADDAFNLALTFGRLGLRRKIDDSRRAMSNIALKQAERQVFRGCQFCRRLRGLVVDPPPHATGEITIIVD